MRMSWRMLLLSLFVIPMAFALDYNSVPWQLVAAHRIFYYIDTSTITTNQNIYIDVNIPESYYLERVQKWLDTGYFCDLVETDPNAWEFFAPAVYYYSTQSNTHKLVQPYSTLESYEYVVCDGNTLSLPKRIRIFLSALDGGDAFASYEHYIIVYFPYGVYSDFVMTPQRKPLTVDVHIPASDFVDIFAKAIATDGSPRYAVQFVAKDGSKFVVSNYGYIGGCNEGALYTTGFASSSDWVALYTGLRPQTPLSDVAYIDKICMVGEGYLGSQRPITWVQILPFAPPTYP